MSTGENVSVYDGEYFEESHSMQSRSCKNIEAGHLHVYLTEKNCQFRTWFRYFRFFHHLVTIFEHTIFGIHRSASIFDMLRKKRSLNVHPKMGNMHPLYLFCLTRVHSLRFLGYSDFEPNFF